ncbi:MAG: ADP-forming succinate--CoA ligase subunit beta [Bacteroidetes bacterium]|nr:ADP-forming succinate--CoA ligase subunit beta [Bacteroidota bacterium]
MKIHEFQAKELLKNHGVAVQDGIAIKKLSQFDKAVGALKKRGINQFVVKSQIHAGGRGKGKLYDPKTKELVLEGGVKFTTSEKKAKEYAEKMLGNILVTIQTGSEGKKVKTLFITEGLDYKTELYLSILLDRGVSKNVIMASTEGGVEIEKVADETPEKIIKVWIDPAVGIQAFHARELGFGLGLTGNAFKDFVKFLPKLYNAYEKSDASMLEINPLIITNDDRIVALDAKMNFDDNALYRHPEILAYRDLDEEDPLEIEASKFSLNYIKLDGNVGCMVNGAGLAMATMDIIKLAGGEPANFLDVGGGANKETVANGFKIILSDKNVKAILINIFGGIVRCDRVAQGVIDAVNEIGVKVPVVVRLEGTNAEEAGVLLVKSGLNFEVAKTLQEAAEKVTVVLKK